MREAMVLDQPRGAQAVLRDYAELSKARIVLMVVLTTLVGYLVAAGGWSNPILILNTLVGTAMVAAGTNALNQYAERNLDGMMARTRLRPLPDGRIEPATALWFAIGISVIGTIYLAIMVNMLTALLGVFTLASYLFIYTPLKRKTTMSTLIGAVPGAIPPMMGWTAATGHLAMGAWILFGILFLWQLPHFLAIGWIYRDDYARAGFSITSVKDESGTRSGRQAVFYSLLLLPISLLPTWFGLTGSIYVAGAFATGAIFIAASMLFARDRTMRSARVLFITSILYLPMVMSLMVVGAAK